MGKGWGQAPFMKSVVCPNGHPKNLDYMNLMISTNWHKSGVERLR